MNKWFDKLVKKYFKKQPEYLEVKWFKIINNIVHARIIDENNQNINFKIVFEKFSESEINKLTNLIASKAILKYKLLNNITPDELINCGVKILPDSLNDIEVISNDDEDNLINVFSVLKVLNEKMIKDNTLIFKIKGLNLRIKDEYPVKKTKDLFKHEFEAEDSENSLTNLYKINNTLLNNVYNEDESFDFIYKELFKFLVDEIDLFKPKPKIYTEYIHFINFKNPIKVKSNDELTELFNQKWNVPNKFKIKINSEYSISKNQYITNERTLFAFLNELRQIDRSKFSYKILFLYDILELTFDLIRHNALIPQVYKTPKNSSKIRWIPSFYDSNVLNLCKSYYDKCPDDLIFYYNNSLSKENQVLIIINSIMCGFIQYYFEKYPKKIFEGSLSITEFNLFTGMSIKLTSKDKIRSLSNISKKLAPFYLKELNFNYAIFIDYDFKVEIKIKDKEYKSLDDANDNELKYLKIIYDLFTQFGIENTIYENIQLNTSSFLVFIEKIKPLLKYINVELITPFEIIETDFELKLDTDLNEDNFSLNKINNVKWLLDIGDEFITLDSFSDLAKKSNGLVKIENKYYVLNQHKFKEFQKYIKSHDNTTNSILQLALLEEYNDVEFELTEKFKNLIDNSSIYNPPKSLKGTLRPYQQIGYSWLVQNFKSGFGSILADDMGLGKTLEVLSAILYLKENDYLNNKTTLIIVPPTLIPNWENEIEKFTPDLTYHIYHGSNRRLPDKNSDIILTSYYVVRNDINKFLKNKWVLCVVDEAQNIKTPTAQQTIAIKQLKAYNKIALTGTPIENRLLDYWSIFDFVNKGYLSTKANFRRKYVQPLERRNDESILENLKTIAKPFVLRRLKSDEEIINELPEKSINDIYCNLTKKQQILYDEIFDDTIEEIESSEGMKRKGMILKTITQLKQICNHPSQYLKTANGKINDSGKMELLIDLLENILDNNEKVIIFTQYVKMGEIIENILSKKFKNTALFLHGSITHKKRKNMIDKFQNDDNYKILIATLKTGGVGLNLTAASNVIHYDLWWNPAIENQATDRVHRIGQNKNVMVYRFITKGTLEEHIDTMVKNKIDLLEKTISNEETFVTEMTNEELKEMLSLRL